MSSPSSSPPRTELLEPQSLQAGALEDRADDVRGERLGPGDQVDPGEPRLIRLHVGALQAEVADPVRADERCELDGAEHADRSTGRVHEPAYGVPRDPGCDGV